MARLIPAGIGLPSYKRLDVLVEDAVGVTPGGEASDRPVAAAANEESRAVLAQQQTQALWLPEGGRGVLLWLATTSTRGRICRPLQFSALRAILAAMSLTQAEVARLSSRDRIVEVLNRAVPLLPADARDLVVSTLRPESIALIAGTLVVWGGSHFFGIGEVVDVVLLGVGVAVWGLSAIDGAAEFCDS
ncbi:MAG TPA: hypothetical protein VJR89_24950 [Polyangiales bacterium]|nr:hypothetical protein [Polyangiales bacterium]